MGIELNGVLQAEQTGAVERTAHSGVGGYGPAGSAPLQDGAFITATVEQGDGDGVTLHLEGGGVLRAAAKGELGLSEGDVIEAIVDKSTGALLLRILNHLGPPAKSAPAPPQQALSDMMSALSRNPEISVAEARFLAENALPVTAENVQVLSQMTKGPGLGALLGQVFDAVSQSAEGAAAGVPNPARIPPAQNTGELQTGRDPQKAAGEAAGSALGEPGQAAKAPGEGPSGAAAAEQPALQAGQTEAEGPAAQQAERAEQKEQPGAQAGEIPAGEPEIPQENAGNQDLLAGAHQAGQEGGRILEAPAEKAPPLLGEAGEAQIPAEEAPPQAAKPGSGLPENPKEGAPGRGTAALGGGQTAAAHREQGEKLEKLIGRLFVRPGEQSGEEIKKTLDETPQTLKTLKSALDQSDIKSKEFCLKTVGQAMKQVELAEKPARFEYLQLPVMENGEGKTAELFVFKRRGGRRGEGEEGTTILVALDTSHIGRVETLVVESKGTVTLEFRLEQTELTEEFKKNSPALSTAVEAAGYSLAGIRFSGLEKRTTLLNAGELIGTGEKETSRGIDIRI